MTTTMMSKPETNTSSHDWLSLSVDVVLSDLEQIVIDVPVYDWRNGNQTIVATEKFLLERLSYATKEESGDFVLDHLSGRGFRRDKKLRVRDTWVYQITQEVIDQIPAEYHKYAEKEFSCRIEEMEKEIQTYKANGLVIKPKGR
jgi:hypothetical protein